MVLCHAIGQPMQETVIRGWGLHVQLRGLEERYAQRGIYLRAIGVLCVLRGRSVSLALVLNGKAQVRKVEVRRYL